MGRYRLYPTPIQEQVLWEHCAHARYVWNLAVEQWSWWQPGRKVRRKAGLNRGILAAGWGRLVVRLDHKAPGRVVRVAAASTSQRCSACGYVAAESRQSQTAFRCVACAWTGNADFNAARNIAAAGQVVAARGGLGSPGPVNREPPTLGAVA